MDRQTIESYSAHAAETAQRYAEATSSIARFFPVAFPPGTRIIDVGCGSGRDLNALLEAGYAAEGIDACEPMIREAERRFPRLAGKLRIDELPELGTVEDASCNGVLCSAVLMHLPEESLFDTVFNLRRILRRGGHLLLSTPVDSSTANILPYRDSEGRLFNGVTPENLQFLFEKVGFRQVNRWDTNDSLGRSERRWATQLFVLESQGSRSLDRIEGILNRDKKVATYKPALFRALAELATTSFVASTEVENPRTSLILFDPPLPDRFVTCIPFYNVAAAAGAFGPDQPIVDPAEHNEWIRPFSRLDAVVAAAFVWHARAQAARCGADREQYE